MLKKIRLGIMGLGEHCLRAHIKHLIKDSRIVIVSAFDPSHESIKKFKEYSPETFVTTNEEDFWLHEIDAVIIASPDQFHGLQLKKAIEKNLHVFCEKPMAVSFKDLNILRTAINIAEEKKLVLATCHPRRLDPPFIWLKEQLINGSLFQSIGKVLHFDFTFWYLKISDNPEDAWKKKRSLLSDHFGHEIDLFAFLFPHEIKEITAKKISDSYRQYEVVGKTASLLSF
jgi:myo-inositol 2-dehydrogenase/D-chiro-inositol 1-dehydrogenase